MSYPNGQYPPPYAPPGQYPPPAQPYPPSSYPAPYPPPGAPGQYPPPTAPGQYPPPASGQYPPAGASGGYPPPGQYPPPTMPIGPQGFDAVDSDADDYLCTNHSKHPMEVTFINRTRQKATIHWIDENGCDQKITTLKPNETKDLDTFETHPFFAESPKKGLVINGNFVFIPQKFPGSHANQTAEITEAPKDVHSLRSTLSGHPATVKFSNRTDDFVSLKWINVQGDHQQIKDIAPNMAWTFNSCEGHYFIACEQGHKNNEKALNKEWFYLVQRGPTPQSVTTVLITEPDDDCDGSSSSTSSSSSSSSSGHEVVVIFD